MLFEALIVISGVVQVVISSEPSGKICFANYELTFFCDTKMYGETKKACEDNNSYLVKIDNANMTKAVNSLIDKVTCSCQQIASLINIFHKMKIAIIGAGASGLAAIKCCIDEGLTPVCFEKQGNIGGLWKYVPGKKDGATVYKSTVINSSKELTCFSDFPMPKDFPNFLHNTKVHEYFSLYAERFKLHDHIQFFTEVMECTPAEKFDDNGQWKIKVKNMKTHEIVSGYYDGVMVCVGHHAVPHYPLKEFQGIDKFKGKYTHSHDYRDFRGYEDLRVLVVGFGNSGGDIAVELSRHSKQVYLSTRRGTIIDSRFGKYGMPYDYTFQTMFKHHYEKILPTRLNQALVLRKANTRFDHKVYGCLPTGDIFAQTGMINDDIAGRILTGSLQVRSNISKFTETSVIFNDDTEEEIDAVIFATGYSIEYPFLDESVLKVRENACDLYKYIYPVSLEKNTLAFIGGIQSSGSTIPVSELQSRWATRVFRGVIKLPSREVMKNDIDQKLKHLQKTYVKSRRFTLQVSHVSYMLELAEQIKCKPNMYKLLLTDVALAMKVYFGPAVPYIFRLEGPGKWSEARRVIMTVQERTLYPLQKRMIDTPKIEEGKSRAFSMI